MLIDTHAHLDSERFDRAELEDVIARARRAGVMRIVSIATDVPSSRAAVALAADLPGVSATVGIDPNGARHVDEAALESLASLAHCPEVVAIGEIGLDYHWDRWPRLEQRRALECQLGLALELGLPVVVHSRDCHSDMLAVLTDWQTDHPWDGGGGRPLGVMHCFAGTPDEAEAYIQLSFMISLAGTVTFRNAARTRAVATHIPLDCLLLETDSPFLAPAPLRGTRNEPANVRLVAEEIARLRGLELEEVAARTSRNAGRLFGWPDDNPPGATPDPRPPTPDRRRQA
jgi:TatD DNase family protein